MTVRNLSILLPTILFCISCQKISGGGESATVQALKAEVEAMNQKMIQYESFMTTAKKVLAEHRQALVILHSRNKKVSARHSRKENTKVAAVKINGKASKRMPASIPAAISATIGGEGDLPTAVKKKSKTASPDIQSDHK